jgi:two-component system sensor histidine kinase UhpB
LATIEDLAKSYGEGTDLTLYRFIQEGVTAAIRKAKAKTVYIDIVEAHGRGKAARETLRATLRFDGAGFPGSKPKDLTIATMAERVRAVGGSCVVRNSKTKGTTIRTDIPIRHASAAASDLELVGGSP